MQSSYYKYISFVGGSSSSYIIVGVAVEIIFPNCISISVVARRVLPHCRANTAHHPDKSATQAGTAPGRHSTRWRLLKHRHLNRYILKDC